MTNELYDHQESCNRINAFVRLRLSVLKAPVIRTATQIPLTQKRKEAEASKHAVIDERAPSLSFGAGAFQVYNRSQI